MFKLKGACHHPCTQCTVAKIGTMNITKEAQNILAEREESLSVDIS